MTTIKEAREAKGWSRAELAHAANINVLRLGEIESGRTPPTRAILEHIAVALGIYLDDLTASHQPVHSVDDSCMCNHDQDRHLKGMGACTWTVSGSTVCSCRRFRRYADVRAQRREEKFWAGVGQHE